MDTNMSRILSVMTILWFVQRTSSLRICMTCHHVRDPSECRIFADCGNKLCGVDLYYNHGEYTYNFNCLPHHDCPAPGIILVGKRATSGQLVCSGCCEGHGCERSLCADYATTMPPATTPLPTTDFNMYSGYTGHTTGMSTIPPLAVDHHTATTTTTTTTLPTTPDFNMYSGYTGHTTDMTTIPLSEVGACVDAEHFNCSELDRYNFCTDMSSVAFAIAHEKCPRHCGFCKGDTTTDLPSLVTTPKATTVTGSASTTMSSGCVDNGDANFSCSHWASLGFCSNQTSFFGHQVATVRCPKTCGFCTK